MSHQKGFGWMPLARLVAATIKADALEPSGLITGLHYRRLFMWHDLSGTASGSGAVSGGEEGGTEKIPKPITQCTAAWGLQAIHYRHHCLLRSLSDFQWEGFAQLCADMLMEASILSTR